MSVETFNNTINSSESSKKAPGNTWSFYIRHGGYFLIMLIWRFACGPKKSKTPTLKDSQFKFIAERLISTLPDNDDGLITSTTQKLLEQHRTIENTQARRRLERWACWTIVLYLASVFILIVLNGVSRVLWPDIFTEYGFISENVMYVILSTTTVNILGLGFIILKGHFPQEDKDKTDNTLKI